MLRSRALPRRQKSYVPRWDVTDRWFFQGGVRMLRLLNCVAWGVCVSAAIAAESPSPAPQGSEIQWQDDYTQATRQAVAGRKMLFVFFHEPGKNSARTAFETRTLTSEALAPFADRYVWARLPTTATITIDG